MNCFISISKHQEINLYPIEIRSTLVNNKYFYWINQYEDFEDKKIQLTDYQTREEVLNWYALKMIND